MKLKKFAAGILAAVMAVTSAISAPVTAGAAAEMVDITSAVASGISPSALEAYQSLTITYAPKLASECGHSANHSTETYCPWAAVAFVGSNVSSTEMDFTDNGNPSDVTYWYQPSNPAKASSGIDAESCTATIAVSSILDSFANDANWLDRYTLNAVTVTGWDCNVTQVMATPINEDGPTEPYTYAYDGSPITMTVQDANWLESGLAAQCNMSLTPDGFSMGMAYSELKALYTGITIENWAIENVPAGLNAEDFAVSVAVQHGADWSGWTATNGTSVNFLSVAVADNAPVQAIIFQINYNIPTGTNYKVGDTFVINAAEPAPVYVTAISISETLALETGATDTLKATLTPADADDVTVSWKSSNDKVATVDANGEVTAVAAGTAVITATANGSDPEGAAVTDTCTVTVTDPAVYVTSISIPETLALETGASETLKATITPADADDVTVSWKSSKESVATVDADGKVTAVAAGTAVITATANGAAEGKTVSDTCTVTVTDPVDPSSIIPQNVAAEYADESVTITWNAVEGATVYRVRKNDGTGWKDLADVKTNSYTDENVTAGTSYRYVVYATVDGTRSGASTIVSVSVPVAKASNVKATAGADSITITWNAVNGADGYRVRRNDGTGWVNLADVNTNSYVDEDVVAGTKYRYVVYVKSNNKYGAASASVSAVVKPADTAVSATADVDSVDLTWTAVDGATSYKIRRNNGSGWVDYATVAAVTSYTDTEVEYGKTYRYAVYAIAGSTTGAASNIVSAKVPVPAATGLVGVANGAENNLTWTAVEGATYRIRRNDGTGWTDYATSDTASFSDTTVTAGTTYRYVVYAVVNGVQSKASNIVSVRADTI